MCILSTRASIARSPRIVSITCVEIDNARKPRFDAVIAANAVVAVVMGINLCNLIQSFHDCLTEFIGPPSFGTTNLR
jgi:hypothetical protein